MDGEESMKKGNESVRLAYANDYPSDHMFPVEARISTGPDFHDSINLIEKALGETIPQGSFFTYLFRRFGYPNIGSDDYKELCRYILTTTHPEMLMSITPYAGGDASISISFLLPGEIVHKCREYPYAQRNQHQANFIKWIEDEGRLPDHIEETTDALIKKGWSPRPNMPKWTTILGPTLSAVYEFKNKNDGSEPTPHVAWYLALVEEYNSLYPIPDPRYRNEHWMKWDDEDPMKPIAAAIFETLHDLKRPVGIRDIDIDPWGPCKEGCDTDSAMPADVAGYPAGYLGNVDPKGFAELFSLITQTCPNDHAKAISIASEAIRDRLEKSQKESSS